MEKKVIDTLDLSSDIIKRLEEKKEELKEVDDTKDEKEISIGLTRLFYQLNDEIKRETDSFNSFSKEMKDKLDKVNSSKKKNNTAKKLFYLMLAMELYRKTPKKASLSFILSIILSFDKFSLFLLIFQPSLFRKDWNSVGSFST